MKKLIISLFLLSFSLPAFSQDFISLESNHQVKSKVKLKHVFNAWLDGLNYDRIRILHARKNIFRTQTINGFQVKYGIGLFWKGYGFGLGKTNDDLALRLRSTPGRVRGNIATTISVRIRW